MSVASLAVALYDQRESFLIVPAPLAAESKNTVLTLHGEVGGYRQQCCLCADTTLRCEIALYRTRRFTWKQTPFIVVGVPCRFGAAKLISSVDAISNVSYTSPSSRGGLSQIGHVDQYITSTVSRA